MRFDSMVNVLGVLAVCSMLLMTAWLVTSGNILSTTIFRSRNGAAQEIELVEASMGPVARPLPLEAFEVKDTFEHRLVVFGDSWSVSQFRHKGQGIAWPEQLCIELSCQVDNFAEVEVPSAGIFSGCVVNNTELRQFQPVEERLRPPLHDLGDQTERWFAGEERIIQNISRNDLELRLNRTTFALSFVLWDLWKFIGKNLSTVDESIRRSIDTIFERLDVLSDRLGSNDLRIILMMSIDPTFLPAFRPWLREQKAIVPLVEDWNQKLVRKAEAWNRGTLFIFDTNRFFLNQIRQWQYSVMGLTDPRELAMNDSPGWENVESPCLPSTRQLVGSIHESCDNPDQYLFWDDMHIGPSAHRKLGSEIYHGIRDLWLI